MNVVKVMDSGLMLVYTMHCFRVDGEETTVLVMLFGTAVLLIHIVVCCNNVASQKAIYSASHIGS